VQDEGVTATVHAAPVVLTMTGELLRDGAVLVEGDRVADIGPRSQVVARSKGARVRDWPGVMTPGLVNAHAHLEYGPPFADLAASGLPFDEWIVELTRRRKGLTDVDWQVSARGSAHQLLRSGTTAVADVVTRGPAIAVAASLGLRGISYAELAGVDAKGCPLVPEHGDDLGGLGADVHVAHGVHVDAADRALLRERQTVVALCTRSNAVLRVGQAPVAAYLAEGSPLAIGTDSLASCPDLDLLAEARATCELARAQGFAEPEEHVLRALTLGGAQALGQDLGTLRPGGRADLAVFDVPVEEPVRGLLAHGAGRCVATVLGGRLVHRR
jgi:cytosine/adenosine deaminase-related metal-dependent hydrolase